MSTRLIQIVATGNLGAGGSIVIPHDLNIDGTAVKPDFIAFDATGFSAVATATTVTVTNDNTGAASSNVWLERKHTIPRQLGGDVLSPSPFVVADGVEGGGGGSPVNEVALVEQVGDPAAVANQAIVYSKDAAGITQAFVRASDGTITQLTPAGVAAVAKIVLAEQVGDPAAVANQVQLYSKEVSGIVQAFMIADDGTITQLTPAGAAAMDGVILAERVGDPGAVANQIQLYGKDVAGVTELFARASDGRITQLTPVKTLFTDLMNGVADLWIYSNGTGWVAAFPPSWPTTTKENGIVQVSGLTGGNFASVAYGSAYNYLGSVQPTDPARGTFMQEQPFSCAIRAKSVGGPPSLGASFDIILGVADPQNAPLINQWGPQFACSWNFFGNDTWWVHKTAAGGATGWQDTGVVVDDSWHVFECNFDGTNYRWYIDGTLVHTEPYAGHFDGNEACPVISANGVDVDSVVRVDWIQFDYAANRA